MLYAVCIKVTYRQNRKRIDVIVEAEDESKAAEKALKKARGIYAPSKKAVYTLVSMVNETEAQELKKKNTEFFP